MITVEELARALYEQSIGDIWETHGPELARHEHREWARELLARIEARRLKAEPIILARPMVSIDTEGTGKNPDDDRIVEFAAVRQYPDGSRDRFVVRVNPGIPIPAETTAIHGITDADVADCPTFAGVAEAIAVTLRDCDITGFNARGYDLRILRAEFDRVGVAFPEGARVVDSYHIARDREHRDLSWAVQFYCGRQHVGAHGALADAEAAMDVMLAQVARYPDLPRDVAGLDLASGGKQPTWASECGKIRWDADGDAVFAFGTQNVGLRLIDAEHSLLYWILDPKRTFPKDVRALCETVLRGQRPRAPWAAPAARLSSRHANRWREEDEHDDGDDEGDDDDASWIDPDAFTPPAPPPVPAGSNTDGGDADDRDIPFE